MSNAIKKSILSQKDLPVPPSILVSLTEMTNRPETTATLLASELSKEPVIASEILRLANTPFYVRARSVSSLKEAVGMLGFRAIKSIVIYISLKGSFEKSSIPSELLASMWEHSVTTGIFSRLLAVKLRVGHPDDAYIAGLLHDVGKLVTFENEPKLSEICSLPEAITGARLLELEAESLDITHPEVGGILAEQWLLPQTIGQAIISHHDFSSACPRHLTQDALRASTFQRSSIL